jgi:hypothetical protein
MLKKCRIPNQNANIAPKNKIGHLDNSKTKNQDGKIWFSYDMESSHWD